MADIRKWCEAPFQAHYVGLTEEQATRFNLPENPEKPGEYQWESLSDDQAGTLIGVALSYLDLDAWAEVDVEEERLTSSFRAHMLRSLDGWKP